MRRNSEDTETLEPGPPFRKFIFLRYCMRMQTVRTQLSIFLVIGTALLAATGCHEVMWAAKGRTGVTAYERGRFGEAEKNFKQALGMMRTLRPQQPYILDELAVLYETQGKYGEAEQLYLQSLEIREKYRGTEHPEVATSLHNLAEQYEFLGQYEKAEEFYERTIAIREKSLGPHHLFLVYSLEDYDGLLRKGGREAEGEKIEARAKAIRAARK